MKTFRCLVFLALTIAGTAVKTGVKTTTKGQDRPEADAVSTVDSPRALKGKKGAPYQVDPAITRPQLVGAHTKWLFCTDAFWVLEGGQCERTQKFVPGGYWFETGRPVPDGTDCAALTGDGDVPVVRCRFKRGLKMVLPVIQQGWVHCDTEGELEDPRLGADYLANKIGDFAVLHATLDGTDVSSLDAVNIVLQDGDADYTYPTTRDQGCVDFFDDYSLYGGCPQSAAGPYVFIDTTTLKKGKHELVLIGTAVSDGFCSAVKHIFTLY